MSSIKFNLISNNVKGLQSHKNIFEYLKNKRGPNGILYLQEAHSTKKMKLDGVMILMVRYILSR